MGRSRRSQWRRTLASLRAGAADWRVVARQLRRAEVSGRLRRLAHGRDDLADDARHEPLVVALGHDADDGLRARRSDDEAAAGGAEPRLGALDGLAHAGVVERRAISVAHV